MINRLAVKDTWPLQIFILGVVGENNALTIEFDVTQWAAGYENCTFAVIYLRPDGQLYPVEIAVDGETVAWTVAAQDLCVAGEGKIELRLMTGDVISKTAILPCRVNPSLTAAGPPVPPVPDWVQEVIDSAGNAKKSAISAKRSAKNAALSEENALTSETNAAASAESAAESARKIVDMTVTAESLPIGSQATVTKTVNDDGVYNLDFGIPEGNVLFAWIVHDPFTGEVTEFWDAGYTGSLFELASRTGALFAVRSDT